MRSALTSMKFWLTLFAAALFGAGIVGRVLAATTVEIVSPTANQIIEGEQVSVILGAKGIKLMDYQTYPRNGYNQGHYHLWLDQDNPTKSSAIKVTTNTYTFDNVKNGDHKLLVEVVNNDHSSLNPKVVASVDFKTVPTKTQNSSTLLIVTIAAFLFLCLTLYFVNSQTKTLSSTRKSPTKSSRKASRRK